MANNNNEINIENVNPEILKKLYEQNERNKKYRREYQQTHKDLVNNNIRKYYNKMKDDPEFLEKRRQQQREFYERNKERLKEKRDKKKETKEL